MKCEFSYLYFFFVHIHKIYGNPSYKSSLTLLGDFQGPRTPPLGNILPLSNPPFPIGKRGIGYIKVFGYIKVDWIHKLQCSKKWHMKAKEFRIGSNFQPKSNIIMIYSQWNGRVIWPQLFSLQTLRHDFYSLELVINIELHYFFEPTISVPSLKWFLSHSSGFKQ